MCSTVENTSNITITPVNNKQVQFLTAPDITPFYSIAILTIQSASSVTALTLPWKFNLKCSSDLNMETKERTKIQYRPNNALLQLFQFEANWNLATDRVNNLSITRARSKQYFNGGKRMHKLVNSYPKKTRGKRRKIVIHVSQLPQLNTSTGVSGCFSGIASWKAGSSLYASFNLDRIGNWACKNNKELVKKIFER